MLRVTTLRATRPVAHASASPGPRPVERNARVLWFGALAAAVCFEGLGRKLFPWIPGTAFYFLKDALLLVGLVAFGAHPPAVRCARQLLRGFIPVALLAILWTAAQVFNPGLHRIEFGLLGLRAYWLWWLAPLAVAGALRTERDRRGASVILACCAVVVASFAVVQFSLPPSHWLNQYASSSYEDTVVATVTTTGRARVTATFAYITGFTDFVILVPALLLALGISSPTGWRRTLLLGAVVLCAIVLPMSGSRAPVVLGGTALMVVAYAVGFVWTRVGRRVVLMTAACVIAAVAFAPEAAQGVRDRFTANEVETRDRFIDVVQLVPPLAMAFVEYPLLGVGTGALQNAAIAAGETPEFAVEAEQGRVLIEQGAPGYLLLSVVRIGFIVAMLRAARLLRRSGQRPAAGEAWVLAALTIPGSLVFNHVFQALFFIGAGFVLEAATRARGAPAVAPRGA